MGAGPLYFLMYLLCGVVVFTAIASAAVLALRGRKTAPAHRVTSVPTTSTHDGLSEDAIDRDSIAGAYEE